MLRIAAALATRQPKRVLAAACLFVLVSAIFGVSAATSLSPAGYEVSGSESLRAAQVVAEQFGGGAPNVVVLVEATDAGRNAATTTEDLVDDPGIATAGTEVTEQLRATEHVGEVVSYWETGSPQLRSRDGQSALIAARVLTDEDGVYDVVDDLRSRLGGSSGLVDVTVGGSGAVNLEIVEQSERDLLRAELLILPITTVVLLFVFRGVVAALLPLIVSAVSVAGTAAALRGLSEVTLVSIFALNLTTALGLGMAIDYSLFLISRWREERARGVEPTEAVAASIHTAGRSILFSGLTTASTIGALLLFDYPLLRSLAVAGFVVVALATVGAVVVLPAAMTLLGDRVERWSIRRPAPRRLEDGRWFRLSTWVMRRPVPVIVATVAGLLLLGSPFLRAEFGLPDDRVLPAGTDSRNVADEVRRDYDATSFAPIVVVLPDTAAVDAAAIDRYALEIDTLDGVARVETAVSGDSAWLTVIPAVEPISTAAADLVETIRRLPAPTEVLVGGESARLVDNTDEIARKLPWVLLWIVAVIFVLLYWSFRSVLIPIKAFLLNLLSLTASFGAIVWIFQDGRLTGLLGYTPTGLTDAQTPVLMFCIAFGLSMDYEVFLLSRIKEEWDESNDPMESVALGVQRTGGIITAAAVLMAVVFLSFATGGVTFIQMVGIGLALSIVMDAVVVRGLLVPAVMAVAGKWNWWTPVPRRAGQRGNAIESSPGRLATEERS